MSKTSKARIHRDYPVSIILPNIRKHPIQAANQTLTAICSKYSRSLSNWSCNTTSIVSPFSRLWILSPSRSLRISMVLKLSIIAHTFPAYFFCDTLNDNKQMVNETSLLSFDVDPSNCENSSWLMVERCGRNWLWYEECFGARYKFAWLQHPSPRSSPSRPHHSRRICGHHALKPSKE